MNSGDGVGRTGSGEQVGDALQDSSERLRGNGVFGLQLSEVRDNLREGFNVGSHTISAGGAVYGL